MATYVDQAYCGWPHEEIPRQDDSQEVSTSQMLDQGSISFGRFAYESLSWEKRSVFTFNKCQEELEKFKCPGLVAKKKAYFEDHYKKVRAMKALQESEQTEITLDYGGDGSISTSSHATEEDETTVQLENLEIACDIAHKKEAPIEIPMQNGKDCNETPEVQPGHSDQDLKSPDSYSQNKFEMLEQGDKDIPGSESLTSSVEESKLCDTSDIDDKGVTQENSISLTNLEHEVAPKEITSCQKNSMARGADMKPADNMVRRKVTTTIRKYKDNISVAKQKEPAGPPRNGRKLEHEAKPNVNRTSQRPKYPIQKTIVKSGMGIDSSRTTADKASPNYKSTTKSSNVTVSRPFSLATERRAAVPSISRDEALKSISRSSNQRSPSVAKGKDSVNAQGTLKQTAVANRNIKSRGLQNKRGHEEDKTPLTLDNQSRCPKARGADVLGSIKSRSHSVPPRNKLSSNRGTDIRFMDGVKDDKCKEVRNEARVSEFHRADSKVFITPTVKLGTETKKMAPSSTANSAAMSGRRPRLGEQSLNDKKPRQEKPRWR